MNKPKPIPTEELLKPNWEPKPQTNEQVEMCLMDWEAREWSV
jgi:hypothetical protein